VAVSPALEWTDAVQVYRRDDATADLGRNWRRLGGDSGRKTWAGLCALGPIAYVGVFVDRSVKERV
jgi:hypothetical protein